jgi:CRISPR-associated protein Csd2
VLQKHKSVPSQPILDLLLFMLHHAKMSDETILTDESELAVGGEIALAPNDAADSLEFVARYVPADIMAKYEVYSYRNAALILSEAHPVEFSELMDALRGFWLTTSIIAKAGGNESDVPKIISTALRPLGWHETTIQADLLIKLLWRQSAINAKGKAITEAKSREMVKARFLDGHKVDYVKNRVAFDLEWNSKDQTFDRDLYAFSAFSQCGVIDAGVLLTRSEALNTVFKSLGLMNKYGASTTWMGKLLYRLNAGRNGSCPVLAIGIKPECVSDWKPLT